MDQPDNLTTRQVDVAGIFFGLKASGGYLVAGGVALLASDLIARPTEDLDLFASTPTTSVTEAKQAFLRALERREYDVTVIQDSPTFCRMVVRRAGDEVLVGLAIDSPPNRTPTVTVLGPTLAPLELAGRKLLALFGRAEARDFADVYVLAQRFGKDALLEQAHALDAGFDPNVLAQMMGTLGRFVDDEIPLAAGDIPLAKALFSAWADELRSATYLRADLSSHSVAQIDAHPNTVDEAVFRDLLAGAPSTTTVATAANIERACLDYLVTSNRVPRARGR